MSFQPTAFHITTLLLLIFTAFVAVLRWRLGPETNWPLVYYAALMVFALYFEGSFPSRYVFGTIVLGLILRFEFMNTLFTRLFMLAETASLAWVARHCLDLLRA
jgi:hypothetical protein